MNLARAAIAYAQHGRRIFPLRPGEKRPLTAHGVKDAHNSPQRIADWWERWPDANIGLALLEHELVVDVDVRSGGDQTLIAWLEHHGSLPKTPTQRTPTTGEHYFFRRPADVELVGKPGPGIDVLGVGKYVVAAPSRIAGRAEPYAWTTRLSTTRLADPPAWLVALVTRPAIATVSPMPQRIDPARAGVVERAEKWLDKANPAISGQGGHATCFRVVSRLVRGFILDADTALALLERVYNPRCAPPWSRRDLKHKIQQAIAKGSCEWGALLNERRSA